ncbi:MAG: C40 family peptidase, partial [Proteobacteria bacterium]|nr:C40 family peptidase [Pseudomonadota bacterium]
MRIRSLILSLSILLLFSACGPSVKKDDAHSSSVNIKNKSGVASSLYVQHSEWKGVRYRYGGLSKKGVDCSGFVYLTFKSDFDIVLPRTTKGQAKEGKSVKRSKLRPGDLVFFKTSRKVRHVGIYIEDDKFLHASTSKGVMIS